MCLAPVIRLDGPAPKGQESLAQGLYVFSAMSQSCPSSSFVLVRFSGNPSEPSAACFLRYSLFHPGKPASIPQPRTRTTTRTIGPLNTYQGKPRAMLFGHFGPRGGTVQSPSGMTLNTYQ